MWDDAKHRPLQMGVLLFANFQCVVRQGFGGVTPPYCEVMASTYK
jgi:hypothetical protein